jgi:hypothetical protein
MSRWTVLLLIVALAWPVGQATAVVCDPSVVEAMPCCERGGEACEMPGMTADCCIVVPGEGLPPAAASVSVDSASIPRDHLASLAAVVIPVPAPDLDATPVREAATRRASLHAERYHARTSVLRI